MRRRTQANSLLYILQGASMTDQTRFYVSGRNLALWTIILLGCIAILRALVIGTNLMQIYLASSYPETAEAAHFQEEKHNRLMTKAASSGLAAETMPPTFA